MSSLAARFDEFITKVNNLKNDYSRVEAMSDSQHTTADQIEAIGSTLNNMEATVNNTNQITANITEVLGGALINLQNLTMSVPTLESSLQMITKKVDIFLGASVYYSEKANSVVQGVILGTTDGVVALSLPSLHQTRFSVGSVYRVAFDWSSRKVYGSYNEVGIKRANLDGTDLEDVLQAKDATWAVDSTSGNTYSSSKSEGDIRVCSRTGTKCSIIARNQPNVGDIVVYPSKSAIFWTKDTSIVRANMDGSNARPILSVKVYRIRVDEAMDRLYWIGSDKKYIASSDLNGSNRKELLNDGSADLEAIAVHGDLLYFAKYNGKSVHSLSKNGGYTTLISKTDETIYSMAFYGVQTSLLRNPCESSPCSHLCVPTSESFTCLCPPRAQVQPDGVSCQ